MGEFARQVREDLVTGPLRQKFKPASWAAAHAKLRTDEEDDNIARSGILIHEKANQIRAALTFTFSQLYRPTTRVRAFVALANLDYCILRDKVQSAMAVSVEEQVARRPHLPPMIHELAAVKIKLPIGLEFHPDEIVQSLVDGMEIPLGRILEKKPNLGNNPEFSKVLWEDVRKDFQLGVLYSYVEQIWDDVLWNEYIVTATGRNQFEIAPAHNDWQVRTAITRARRDTLTREFWLHAEHARQRLALENRLIILGRIDVKSIEKNGRKQILKLGYLENAAEGAGQLLAMRLYASEPYYGKLLSEPQELLAGGSLNQLLTAWVVVSKASSILLGLVHARDVPQSIGQSTLQGECRYPPSQTRTGRLTLLRLTASQVSGVCSGVRAWKTRPRSNMRRGQFRDVRAFA
jgi:hypothetical protein